MNGTPKETEMQTKNNANTEDKDPLLRRIKQTGYACLLTGKPPMGSEERIEGSMRSAWLNRDEE